MCSYQPPQQGLVNLLQDHDVLGADVVPGLSVEHNPIHKHSLSEKQPSFNSPVRQWYFIDYGKYVIYNTISSGLSFFNVGFWFLETPFRPKTGLAWARI